VLDFIPCVIVLANRPAAFLAWQNLAETGVPTAASNWIYYPTWTRLDPLASVLSWAAIGNSAHNGGAPDESCSWLLLPGPP